MIPASLSLRGPGRPQAALFGIVAGLGVLLALAPLPWALALLGAAVSGLALLVWPVLGLLLLPLAVPFGSLREVTLGGLNAGAAEVLLATTLAAWAARMLATRRLDAGRPVLLLPLLGFLGTAVLSLTQADALSPAVKETIKWLEVGAVYLAVCGLVRNRQQLLLLLGALLLAGAAEAGVGVFMAVRRIGPPAFAILDGRLYRAAGNFGQPNPFGGYMNLVWPLAASLVLARLLGTHKTKGFLALGGTAVAGGLVGLGLVLSWSRGAWLGAAAGGAVLVGAWLALALWGREDAVGRPEGRKRAAVAVVVAATVALIVVLGGAFDLVPTSATGRLESSAAYLGGFDPAAIEVTDENFATVERVAHWAAAAAMWADHPWLGVGIGNYATAYPRYNLPRWTDPLGHAHNYYLNVGAEMGLLGFVAYAILLVAAFTYCARVAQRRGDVLVRAIAIGALGVLAAMAVHNLFDNLYVHDMALHIGLVLGLVSASEGTTG